MTLEPLALPTSPEEWPTWLRERTTTELAAATALVDGLRATPPADPIDLLRQWDRASGHLGNVAAAGSLFGNVLVDEAARTIADEAEQEASRVATAWSLDRELYEIFAGIEESAVAADVLAARLLAKIRNDFRRSGVDRDDETRQRITDIRERMTELDQAFSRLIRDDVRTIRVAPERLAGMPADWLEAHPVDDDGLVAVTTDYPDAVPVRMFVHDQEVRRDLTLAFLDRGWPDAEPLLTELFDLRHELATLVGFADWPSYDADVKMIGRSNPVAEEARNEPSRSIPEFIDKIAAAAAEPMERDLAQLLERYRRDFPDAIAVPSYDYNYYAELVRSEQYAVDSQRVRTYLAFGKVRQGLLDVTGRLFGLRYEPVDVPVWHEDVTAYDVYAEPVESGVEPVESGVQPVESGVEPVESGVEPVESGVEPVESGVEPVESGVEPVETRLGRIYLDLHPREGKYKHAAQFTLVDGVADPETGEGQLPEGVLVCNFARGLMEHDHVVTLFHEFGHLLHHVLAGHGAWARFAGVATEWDFVEAPSQMLEEWAWDAAVLQEFATNAAGEPIPADLVAAMRAADDYGKGIGARTQMFYAAISYWFHADRAATSAATDLTDRMIELQEKYAALPYLEDTHFFASFGHLGGYSSGYYTYMWSLVIAKDMFSAFDEHDLFAPGVAHRYRDRVLVPGGGKDAAALVADFLGRPFSFDAYAAWLAR